MVFYHSIRNSKLTPISEKVTWLKTLSVETALNISPKYLPFSQKCFFFPKQFLQEENGSAKFDMSQEHFAPKLCFISNFHQLKHPKCARCPRLCTYGDFYFPSKYSTWNTLLPAGTGLQCFKKNNYWFENSELIESGEMKLLPTPRFLLFPKLDQSFCYIILKKKKNQP